MESQNQNSLEKIAASVRLTLLCITLSLTLILYWIQECLTIHKTDLVGMWCNLVPLPSQILYKFGIFLGGWMIVLFLISGASCLAIAAGTRLEPYKPMAEWIAGKFPNMTSRIENKAENPLIFYNICCLITISVITWWISMAIFLPWYIPIDKAN